MLPLCRPASCCRPTPYFRLACSFRSASSFRSAPWFRLSSPSPGSSHCISAHRHHVSYLSSHLNPSYPESQEATLFSTDEFLSVSRPASYVHISGASLSASTLKAIFERHSTRGVLGVITDRAACLTPLQTQYHDQGRWEKHSLIRASAHPDIEYFVSTTYHHDLPITPSSLGPTLDGMHASHLNTFALAGLRAVISLPHNLSRYTTYILERPPFVYPPLSSTISNSLFPSSDGKFGNIPTLEEWRKVWSTWDLITLQMIPANILHQKPIDLRHKCLSYIGHIPTFLDMLLSKSIGGPPTESDHFWNIFERNIDPYVEDRDHCHASPSAVDFQSSDSLTYMYQNHSEVPGGDEDWPTLESIIRFRDGVRARLADLYHDISTGRRTLTRNIARTLVVAHEYQGFYIEALLSMLIQKVGRSTLPPPGLSMPPWHELRRQWATNPTPSAPSVLVGPATVTLGHDDSEADDKHPDFATDVQGHTFGWDNESPARQLQVKQFRAEWRPITIREFELFLRGDGKGLVSIPTSWVEEDGLFKVKTMYGPLPMEVAEHWPVLTSYDDLARYADAKGGRLPTEPELRLFLDLYDVGYEGGANVGFRNWHPVPATTGTERQGGKGSNGGVWEWTSTVFDNHEGLVPTQLFTSYSGDSFDAKHHVALGASYATIPRLAGRRTVRNPYKHNYSRPWIGARVVYDI